MWRALFWFLGNYFSPIYFMLRVMNLYIAQAFSIGNSDFGDAMALCFFINAIRPWKRGVRIGTIEAVAKHKYNEFIEKANRSDWRRD